MSTIWWTVIMLTALGSAFKVSAFIGVPDTSNPLWKLPPKKRMVIFFIWAPLQVAAFYFLIRGAP